MKLKSLVDIQTRVWETLKGKTSLEMKFTTLHVFIFRRQFNNAELESKLIKLIFNGQILEDDRKSLKQYGVKANAVVHCLILQKRNVITPASNQPPPRNNHNSLLNSTIEWNGTLFIYILGMILVSLTLVFCW